MPVLLVALLAVPGPGDADRGIVYDVSRLPLARAVELEGRPRLYCVAMASTADEDGPTVAYDVEAPHGLHGSVRLPALPIGHEFPESFVVEGVLQVVRHPARETGGAFTEYRIVGRMTRPVPPGEDDEGEPDDARPGLGLPRPDA